MVKSPISASVVVSGPICQLHSSLCWCRIHASNANGPIMIAATNSPYTIGSYILLKNSCITFSEASKIPTAMIRSVKC